jgi:hypothetical protein
MCKRRVPMLFIGFSIFLIFLSSCHKTTSRSAPIITRASSDEVNLSDGIVVNVTLSPETDNQQCIATHLVTNSKEISVSCASLPAHSELLLSLYDESRTPPLFSTSLSAEEPSTTFRPLTSVKLYKLVAVVKNCPNEDDILITITD